jgi:hypothetical protein
MEKASVQLKLEKQKYNYMYTTIKTKSKTVSFKMYGNPQLIEDCDFLEIYKKLGNVTAKRAIILCQNVNHNQANKL